MRHRVLRLAAFIRGLEHRLEHSFGGRAPRVLLLVWATLTALVARQSLSFVARPCAPESVDFARLEVTFSLSRFAASLPGTAECKSHVAWSFFTWDVAFPLFYGPLLCALYLWLERWRRVGPDDAPCGDTLPCDLPRALLVLAPLAAAICDVIGENIPLGFVARALTSEGQENWSLLQGAVCVGSLAAVSKWFLLWLSVLGSTRELFAGPRGLVLARVRFSVLAVALGGIPLAAIDQGQDILQRIFEGANGLWSCAATLLSLALVALATWYCGRKLLELQLDERVRSDQDQSWYKYFAEDVPRILGIASLALGGLALARAGLAVAVFTLTALLSVLLPSLAGCHGRWSQRLAAIGNHLPLRLRGGQAGPSEALGTTSVGILLAAGGAALSWWMAPGDDAWTSRLLRLTAFACLGLTWCFRYYVRYRRQIAHARHAASAARNPGASATPAPPERPPIDALTPAQIGSDLRWQVLAGLLLSALCFLLFTVFPVPVGRSVSSLGVLCVFTANTVFFGSIAVWAGKRFRFPVVTLALGCAALFSLWNDGHAVRLLEKGSTEDVAERPNSALQFASWRDAADGPGRAGPVFLVASQGGGLRAAYWAAMSLAAIDNESPGFARSVFAFSGVSGGSLGGALFAALVRDTPLNAAPTCKEPAHRDRPPANFGEYGCRVRAFMSGDYLSPLLARFVSSDFLQGFLPFSSAAFDRSTALEQAWEKSYEDITGKPTFREGLAHFARDPELRAHAPMLLLNATQVESGRRFIGSTLALHGGAGGRAQVLDAADVLALLGRDIPFSTAVHNSARFPWISPAGHLDLQDGDERGHLVDGGYFENSGLATLREVFDLIAPLHENVYVLYLCNDPASCARDDLPVEEPVAPAAATEWLAPVRGLLQTRNARASLARAALRSAVQEGHFLQLNVCAAAPREPDAGSVATGTPAPATEVKALARERVISPPLGWVLSWLARDWMDRSLLGLPGGSDCYAQNARILATIRQARRPPAP